MHSINFVATGGEFGKKRILSTYELIPTTNDKIEVWDQYSKYHSPVAYVTSVDEAIKLFGKQDEYRMRDM